MHKNSLSELKLLFCLNCFIWSWALFNFFFLPIILSKKNLIKKKYFPFEQMLYFLLSPHFLRPHLLASQIAGKHTHTLIFQVNWSNALLWITKYHSGHGNYTWKTKKSKEILHYLSPHWAVPFPVCKTAFLTLQHPTGRTCNTLQHTSLGSSCYSQGKASCCFLSSTWRWIIVDACYTSWLTLGLWHILKPAWKCLSLCVSSVQLTA